MADDILDLFTGNMKLRNNKSSHEGSKIGRKDDKEAYAAPIEKMSEFLMLITQHKMKEALVLSDELLRYEPNNKLLLDYRSTLKEFVAQGLAEEEKEEEEEEDEDDDEEEDQDEIQTDLDEEDEEDEGKEQKEEMKSSKHK